MTEISETSIINGTCYYIEINDFTEHVVRFYTPDGDLIKEVGINDSGDSDSLDNTHNQYYDKFLDPKCIDQFRPAKVVFTSMEKKTRVSFKDKHDNVVICNTYNGQFNELEYINYLLNKETKPIYQLDFDWLFGDEVVFEKNVSNNKSYSSGRSCVIQ